jgi:hypothetical protein
MEKVTEETMPLISLEAAADVAYRARGPRFVSPSAPASSMPL